MINYNINSIVDSVVLVSRTRHLQVCEEVTEATTRLYPLQTISRTKFPPYLSETIVLLSN